MDLDISDSTKCKTIITIYCGPEPPVSLSRIKIEILEPLHITKRAEIILLPQPLESQSAS